jgi:protein-S-isoprenylcysteine O-methyltransferase Ste14
MTSPWWYRARSFVFAAIYFAGFFLGAAISVAISGRYVSVAGTSTALTTAAAVLAALCYALRVWGSSYLRAGIVWNADARSDAFFVAGPYRFVRNPLYLGNVLLAIGVGLMAPPAGCAFIIVANILFVIMLARHEETILSAVYGERFRQYAAHVPALIPRLVPVAAQGDAHPSLADGVLSEVFTGALLIGIILTFVDRKHGEIDFFVLYGAGIIAQRLIARNHIARLHNEVPS